MQTGTIFDIKRYAIHDGPGIRITIFLQGCPLQCWWCHNPEGIPIEPAPRIRASKEVLTERPVSVRELMEEIEKEIVFFDESGGGVTFSGGEPLMQPVFLQSILEECKKLDLHTALDTTGYASPQHLESVMDLVDLFLYDLKLIDEERHIQYTGVSCQPILENLKRLINHQKDVTIRFPLIPSITDTEENIVELGDYLSSLNRIKTIHILPYHKTASEKYRRLHREDKMKGIEPPAAERIEASRNGSKTGDLLWKLEDNHARQN